MSRKTLRERLSERFKEIGWTVLPGDIYPARGHWRTSPYADVFRWEAQGKNPEGVLAHLGSWDTMTDCARTGIEIDEYDEVSAKGGRSFGERNPKSPHRDPRAL